MRQFTPRCLPFIEDWFVSEKGISANGMDHAITRWTGKRVMHSTPKVLRIFFRSVGCVHTLGTLLEDADGAYKRAIRSGDVPGLLCCFWRNVVAGGSGGNPLEKHQQLGEQAKRGTYEVMNRDSGKSFISVTP